MDTPTPTPTILGIASYGPAGFEIQASVPGEFGGTRTRAVWASGHTAPETAEAVAEQLRGDPERLRAAWVRGERPDRRAP